MRSPARQISSSPAILLGMTLILVLICRTALDRKLLRLTEKDLFRSSTRTSPNVPNTTDGSFRKRKSRRIPNVQLAGVPKAGTTALASHLFYQGFCGPGMLHGLRYTTKETQFFDNEPLRGLPYYQTRFAHCPEDAPFIMDGSPGTVLFPKRVYNIYKQQGTTDKVKFIFSLREPVAREVSFYQHLVRDAYAHNRTKPPLWLRDGHGQLISFASYTRIALPLLNHAPVPYTRVGLYAHFLKQWFQYFDRTSQILIVHYDDFKENSTDVLTRIHAFLELPTTNTTSLTAPTVNVHRGPAPAIDCASQEKWAERFERSNQELYALLDSNPGPPMERRLFRRFEFKCK